MSIYRTHLNTIRHFSAPPLATTLTTTNLHHFLSKTPRNLHWKPPKFSSIFITLKHYHPSSLNLIFMPSKRRKSLSKAATPTLSNLSFKLRKHIGFYLSPFRLHAWIMCESLSCLWLLTFISSIYVLLLVLLKVHEWVGFIMVSFEILMF